MAYHAYVTKLTNVRPHPNADRLQLADCFGNTTCVNLDYTEGQLVVYFPVDGQLSEDFCEVNHLCRKKKDGTPDTGYLDENKRNVVAIRLRGEKSDGLALPITCLESFGDITTLNHGDVIDVFNGHEICRKYIPRSLERHCKGGHGHSNGNRTRKKKVNIAPLFHEHADTEQLNYNLGAFKCGDEIEITLKMHGTSQRTGYLPVFKGYADSWHRNFLNKIWFWFNYVTHKHDLYTTLDMMKHDGEPIYEYDYISGTRRTVLEDFKGGFYGSNKFREQHSKFFEGKLWKGEEVYYEVVGFTHTGTPIMAECANKKLNDKNFVKQYGETTVFSYGCAPDGAYEFDNPLIPQSDVYVYRMTMTNEDGDVVEYTPDFMRYRCEQMGVKTVPVMWKGTIPENLQTEDFISNEELDFVEWIYAENAGEWIKNKAEQYYDGPDPIGKTHVREGVVVRILNRPKFTAYKTKNFSFKCLEGLVKAEAEMPDMEEREEILEEAQENNNE